MALPIISAEERLKERHSAKICLVGFPGVGKTSQIKTLPAQSTLFVDLVASCHSIPDLSWLIKAMNCYTGAVGVGCLWISKNPLFGR
jgi:predicted GTPase